MSSCVSPKLEVTVLDKDTLAPIPSAFVLTREGNKLNPWNSAGLYLTDSDGKVLVEEYGMVDIIAGKEGYDLSGKNVFMDSMASENDKISMTMHLSSKTNDGARKTPKIRIRDENLYSPKSFQYSLVKDFYLYCKKRGIPLVNRNGEPIIFE